MRLTTARSAALLSLGLFTAAAGCASSSKHATTPVGRDSGTPTPSCARPVRAATATQVKGSTVDWDLTSFDGTRIRLHWMPVDTAGTRRPTVLMGPGWSLPGSTEQKGAPGAVAAIMGGGSIATLHDAGYNVLTWDPRGFGASAGEAEVDSADFEGRDVERLIDWVAGQPGVELDRPGDPRMGMVGGSYGGGIQYQVAALDCRVDAIVPNMAWNSLETSLYKSGLMKAGWAGLLIAAAPTAHLDPHITTAYDQGKAQGTLEAAEADWFRARGPGDAVAKIKAPTLIVQGTADTLFTLDEGITNYRLLRKAGTTVSMLWYCGGHGPCLTDPGDPNAVGAATLAWLDRWVKKDAKVDVGARVDLIDNEGNRYQAEDYPIALGEPVVASGTGTLALKAEGGSGPLPANAPTTDFFATFAKGILPGPATNAVDVSIPAPATARLVVGAPELHLTYQGTVAEGDRPTRVFAQLVDDATGLVVGNQVTPLAVTLDGASHEVTVPLEVVSYALRPTSKLRLQLVAATTAYAEPRFGGEVTFQQVEVRLPVAKGLTPPSR